MASIPAICALRFWVEQYTWRPYEMEPSWRARLWLENMGHRWMGNEWVGTMSYFLSLSRAQEHSIHATIVGW